MPARVFISKREKAVNLDPVRDKKFLISADFVVNRISNGVER